MTNPENAAFIAEAGRDIPLMRENIASGYMPSESQAVIDEYMTRLARIRMAEAAPELLAALEIAALRIELANSEGNPILSAWLPDARAAIAKARGASQT